MIAFTFSAAREAGERGAAWFIANPVRSYLWAFPEWRSLDWHEATFDLCAFGSGVKIPHRIRSSESWIKEFAKTCDGQHAHADHQRHFLRTPGQSKPTPKKDLPDAFCDKFADQLAKQFRNTPGKGASGTLEAACAFAKTSAFSTDANKRKVALQAASAGIQARGKRLEEIITEYKAKISVEVPPSEAKALVLRERFKAGKKLGATTLKDDAQVLAITHGDNVGLDLVRVELGIAWSPAEFLHQASLADHPFDSLVVSPEAAVAVARSLSNGSAKTRTHQEDTLNRWSSVGFGLQSN